MVLSRKAQLLSAAMVLLATATAFAQEYGRGNGSPSDGVETSRQSGGYCDSSGCPDHFWKYRIYYGPVFYHHRWFRGPVYVKDDYGRNLFWVAGGWHRDEWHARRPDWARNAYSGPPQSRDYYQTNNFGRGDRYGENGPHAGDRQQEYQDNNGRDGRPNRENNGGYNSGGAASRNDGYMQNHQGYRTQDGGPSQDQSQAAAGYGRDQRTQYGTRQGNGQNDGPNNWDRSANGGPQNYNNQNPGAIWNSQGARRAGQDIAQAQGQSNAVKVTAATYGASCKQPAGNVTKFLADACNGKTTCDYVIKYQTIGDPAPGCAKDFSVQWTCSNGVGGTASAPAEAGLGSKVSLQCAAYGR